MTFQLTLRSSNRKTGPIPVATSSRDTCPTSCGMREACYARYGKLRMVWDRMGRNASLTWDSFLAKVRALPAHTLWRYAQAGDLPGEGDVLDADMLDELVRANVGKRGFTYTHKPPTPDTVRALAQANAEGFTVNLSADSPAHADVLARHGLPTVVVMPDVGQRVAHTPEGRRIMVCPATYRDVTCAKCACCADAVRSYIVGFPVHGSGTKHYRG